MKEKPSLAKKIPTIKKGNSKSEEEQRDSQENNVINQENALTIKELEEIEVGDPTTDMRYIGRRIRTIRQDSLGKTQLQFAEALNAFYGQDDLFNQPRLYQIELLKSMGRITFLLLNYLVTLGFSLNWIIAIDNEEIPQRISNVKHLDLNDKTQLLKGAAAIKKQSIALQESIDEFNENIERNLNNM